MTYLILRVMINAIAIVVAVKIIEGITFSGEWWKMIIIGAIFGLINSLIKPITMFLTLPFIIFTLGLFILMINTLMLTLTAFLSDSLNLGLQIDSFWSAFWGALIISIVSMLFSWITGERKIKYYGGFDR